MTGCPLSEDRDGIGGGRFVAADEEYGVLIALKAGNVINESDKGAAGNADPKRACGVGGPGVREHGGQLGGIVASGGVAGGGQPGVVGPATDLKFVDGLEAGDRVVSGRGGWTEQGAAELQQ